MALHHCCGFSHLLVPVVPKLVVVTMQGGLQTGDLLPLKSLSQKLPELHFAETYLAGRVVVVHHLDSCKKEHFQIGFG